MDPLKNQKNIGSSDEKFLTTREASNRCGYHSDYLGRLCRSGKITGKRIGRSWLVSEQSLNAFVKEQEAHKQSLRDELSKSREREYKQNVQIASIKRTLHKLTPSLAVNFVAPLRLQKKVLLPDALAESENENVKPSLVSPVANAFTFEKRAVALLASLVVMLGGVSLVWFAHSATGAEAENLTFQFASGMQEISSGALASLYQTPTIAQSNHHSAIASVADARSENFSPFPITLPTTLPKIIEPRELGTFATTTQIFSNTVSQDGVVETEASQVEVPPQQELTAANLDAFIHASAYYALHPSLAISSGVHAVSNASVQAYVGTGVMVYKNIVALMDTDAHASIGWSNFSQNILHGYSNGVYAWVKVSPEIPAVANEGVYVLGSTIADQAALSPWVAKAGFQRVLIGFVDTSRDALTGVTKAEIAFGTTALNTTQSVSDAEETEADAVALNAKLAGETSFVALTQGMRATQTAARGGKDSASHELAAAAEYTTQNYTLGEATAVATYDTLHGLFVNIANEIALLFGNGTLTTEPTSLAIGAPTGSGVVHDAHGASLSPTHSVSGTNSVSTSNTQNSGGSSLPNYNGSNSGVSQTYVDIAIANLHTFVVNEIEALQRSEGVSGGGSGGSGGGGSSFDLAALLQTLLAGNLDIGSTTFSGPVTVASDFQANGNTTLGNTVIGDSTTTNSTSTNLYATNGSLDNLLATNATITNATTTNFFAQVAEATTAIFQNLTATLATITNLTTSEFTATDSTTTNATSTNLYATNATFQNIFAGVANYTEGAFQNFFATNATTTNATSTNLYATNGVIDNSTSTNQFTTNLNATNATTTNLSTTNLTTSEFTATDSTTTNATTTNLYAANGVFTNTQTTNATTTNATSTNLYASNGLIDNSTSTNLYATNGSLDNLLATNATITNATTTNFFAQVAEATTAIFQNLTATLATITNLTTSEFTATDSTTTNATTTNLYATNGIFGNLVATIANFTTGIFQNLVATNFTTTNATSTNATSTNLYATNGVINNSTSTNEFATNLGTTNATSTNQFSTNFNATNATTTNLGATNITATNGSLNNLLATNATITNATSTNFFAQLVQATSAIFQNLTATLATITNLNSTNFITTNATSTNASSTNLYASNGVITNATSTNQFATNLGTTNFNTTNATTTNLTATNAAITNGTTTNAYNTNVINGSATSTNEFATNLGATNSTSTNLYASNGSLDNLLATNATITNATTTNFFAQVAEATTAIFQNLTATLATITNLTTSEFTATDSTTTNATTTNLYATNGIFGNLVATIANFTTGIFQNLVATNFTTTNATSTNEFVTNAAITNATLTNATTTNFYAVNGAFTNATSTEFDATDLTATNITASNLTDALALFTSASTTNFYASLASIDTGTITNFASTLANISNLVVSNATTTNATSTNEFATNFGSTNLTTANANIGALTLSNLTGILEATSGVVTATSSIDLTSQVSNVLPQQNGGTGYGTYNPGDILYADAYGNLQKLPASSNGLVLKLQGGIPYWGVDQTVGSSGNDGIFSTSTNLIYPLNTANTLVVGGNTQSDANSLFEVHGGSYFSGNVGIGSTSPFYALSVEGISSLGNNAIAGYFTATTTATSSLPSLSTNSLAIGSLTGVLSAKNGFVTASSTSVVSAGTGVTFSGIAGSLVGGTPLTINTPWTISGTNIFNNNSGKVGIGTTTPGSLLSIGSTNGINFGNATSTFSTLGGISLTNGCYALNGSCIGTSLNGLSGTLGVANGGTGATTLTGLIKGNGTSPFTAAVAGTDYLAPSSLSAGTGIGYNSGTGVISNTGVVSFNGRTGAVVPGSSDYTTSQVAEGTNLYFTNARAIGSTLTGYTSAPGTITSSDTILSAIQKLNGNISSVVSGVSSVTSPDTSLTISPNTGAVLASLNLAHANSFTALQQFNGNASTTQLSVYNGAYFGATATTTIDNAGNVKVVGNGLTVGTTQLVAANGNIGFGNANPLYPIDVGGTGELAQFGSTGAEDYIGISNGNALFGYDNIYRNAVVQGATGQGIEFNVNNGTFPSGIAAVITTGGNFGIGTTSPGSPLSVNGNAYVTGQLNLGTALSVPNGGTGSTTLTGLLKGNGTGAVQTAIAGIDYQGAGNYITALTGDITATGPGIAVATLANVNANTGPFGSSTAIPTFTVNSKGLITAAGSVAVVAPAGTLTGTTLASNVVNSSLTSLGTLGTLTVSGQTTLGNASSTLLTANTLFLPNQTSTLLKTTSTGQVVAAVGDTDYQRPITLTTTGTSGAATFSGDTLNIPAYAAGVTSVANADGTLTISPTAGAVVASLNLAHANIFSALQTFGALTANGTVTLGTLNGPLQANAGVVSATTSVGVLYGGTGLTVAPTYGQILVGNAARGYTLTSTSSLGLLTSAIQNLGPAGQTQSGPTILLATTTSTTNGLTSALTITGAGNTLTYAPSLSGTLTVAGGGTGAASLTGLLKGNGTSPFTAAVAGTDYLAPTSLSAGTGIGYNSSTGVISNTGVTSIANADGTLTVSSPTGAVNVALNLANANTWTGTQTFNNSTYSALFTGGPVGINTATPAYPLDIGGTGELARLGSTGAQDFLSISNGNALFGYDNVYRNAVVQGGLGQGIEFNVNNSSFPSGLAAVLTSGGNFGVGTTSPYQTLSVAGNAVVTGNLTLGTLNGPLQANAGVVSATSSIGVIYGGTGLTTAPTFGQILVGNAARGYTLTSTSSLGLITAAIQNLGPAGQTQSGPTILQATTTSTTNGLTSALAITGSGNTLTYAPSLTGTLAVAGGGTGATTLTGLVKGNGTSPFTAAVAGTDYLAPTSLSGGTGISYNSGTGVITNTGVTSITNSDGTLTITPTTTAVNASLNLANANTWTATQTFNNSTYSALFTGGNVGIGTTSPAHLLTINASDPNTNLTTTEVAEAEVINSNVTANDYAALAFDTTDTTGAAVTGSKITGIFDNHTPGAVSGDLAFITENAGSNGERMRLTSSGNLGIATSTPLSRLAVGGNATIGADYNVAAPTNGLLVEGNVGIGTTTTAAQFTLDSPSTIATTMRLSNGSAGAHIYSLFTSGSANPGGVGRFGIYDYSTANEDLTIAPNGNVGISSTSPNSLLSIGNTNGINFSTATSTFSSTGGINLTNGCYAINGVCLGTSAGVTSVTNSDGSLTINPNAGAVVASLNVANPNLWTGTQTFSNATYSALFTGGNVGIGTSTPVRALDVAGNGELKSQILIEDNNPSVTANNHYYGIQVANGVFNINAVNDNYSTSTAFTINQNNNVGIGTTTPGANLGVQSPFGQSALQPIFQVGSTTSGAPVSIFSVGANGYGGQALTTGTGVVNFANNLNCSVPAQNCYFSYSGSTRMFFTGITTSFSAGGNSSNSGAHFAFTAPTDTNISAGVNSYIEQFNNAIARTHGTGALAEEDEMILQPATETFGAGTAANSVISTTSAFTIQGIPTVGARGSFVNNFSFLINPGSSGSIAASTTNNYGIGVYAPTGGTNNYAAEFLGGNVGIGTTSPGSLLSLGNTNGINFSTATSTFSSTGGINLANGCYAINGVCLGTSAGVTSVTNSDGTLTINPTAGAVVASLNLANANTWTGTQTFNNPTYSALFTGGNVGIGTSTPTRALDIAGNGELQSQILIEDNNPIVTANNHYYGLQVSNGVFNINAINDNYSTSTAFTINQNNNVGIGSTTPGANLSVQSPFGQNALQPIFQVGSTTSGSPVPILSVGPSGYGGVNTATGGGVVAINNALNFVNSIGLTGAIAINGSNRITLTNNSIQFNASVDSGNAGTHFQFNAPQDTSILASTNAYIEQFNNAVTRTHATGALAEEDEMIVQPAIETFGAGTAANSVISTTSAFTIQGIPTVGARGSFGNDFSFLINPGSSGSIAASSTNNYGLGVYAPTGGLNNYAAEFLGGNVGVGTTSPWRTLSVTGTMSISGLTVAGSSGSALCLSATNEVIVNSGAGSCTVSSQRFKNTIQSSNTGLAEVMALNPVTYYLNSDTNHTDQQYGFIAEQANVVDPKLVDINAQGQIQSFRYEEYTAVLTKAIQQLAGAYSLTNLGSLSASTSPTVASAYAGGSTAAISVDASGNVGIGTAAAATNGGTTSKLTVNGDISANNVNVTNVNATNVSTTGSGTFKGTLNAPTFEVPGAGASLSTYSNLTVGSTSVASAITADGGVDIYRLALANTSNIAALATQTTALASQTDSISTQLTSLTARVSALEAGAAAATASLQDASSTQGDILSASTTAVVNALSDLGVLIQKGVAQFDTLVVRDLVFSKDSAGSSAAGSGTILTGNTSAQVSNAHMLASSLVSVTITSNYTGDWHVADKQDGSFQIIFSVPQTSDVSFDYVIIQTQGQLATSTADTTGSPFSWLAQFLGGSSSTPSQNPPTQTPAPSPSPTPSPSAPNSPNAPIVTLKGDAAISMVQGTLFVDPGASAVDASGTDITSSIVVSGSVDANTPGMYTLTYTATDAAGNTGNASRVVSVTAAPSLSSGGPSGSSGSSSTPAPTSGSSASSSGSGSSASGSAPASSSSSAAGNSTSASSGGPAAGSSSSPTSTGSTGASVGGSSSGSAASSGSTSGSSSAAGGADSPST